MRKHNGDLELSMVEIFGPFEPDSDYGDEKDSSDDEEEEGGMVEERKTVEESKSANKWKIEVLMYLKGREEGRTKQG